MVQKGRVQERCSSNLDRLNPSKPEMTTSAWDRTSCLPTPTARNLPFRAAWIPATASSNTTQSCGGKTEVLCALQKHLGIRLRKRDAVAVDDHLEPVGNAAKIQNQARALRLLEPNPTLTPAPSSSSMKSTTPGNRSPRMTWSQPTPDTARSCVPSAAPWCRCPTPIRLSPRCTRVIPTRLTPLSCSLSSWV